MEAPSTQQDAFPYLDRELSWLDFNRRVLEEAGDPANPLVERMKFLAITASNLDEFMMVRAAGVMRAADRDSKKVYDSGLTPRELLPILLEKLQSFEKKQYACLDKAILPALEEQGIRILSPWETNRAQQAFLADYFDRVLYPVLTPMAADRSRPFPRLRNKSLSVAVRLEDREEPFAVVPVPQLFPRLTPVPSDRGRCFVLLEELIRYRMEALFPQCRISACIPFRLTRNFSLNFDEDSEDLLAEIKASIKKRRSGRPVRLELLSPCREDLSDFLTEVLKLPKDRVFPVPGPLDLTLLSKLAETIDDPELRFAPIRPADPPADFVGEPDLFAAIRKKDCMLHHPYESFQVVIDLIRAAAKDPQVLAMKQTLYRVSGNSPIVAALMEAAEQGKEVTVLVELKARFDEENNLRWAKKLETAGCHVLYGQSGLKTHCKLLLIVRREGEEIRRYVHLGTGNYNDVTAQFYTDIGLLTCKESYGADAAALFHMLTGYARPVEYRRFITAPYGLRDFFRERIHREMDCAKRGRPAGITAKLNALTDPEMIRLLYEASGAGVPVRLIVRGVCCLLPGVPGVSETIQVRSLVGQLLEHSRIYRFENGGHPKIYLGSADWMQRNLDRRVELVFPVGQTLRPRCEEILRLLWDDTGNAWIMQPDGRYRRPKPGKTPPLNCHRAFSDLARAAAEEAAEYSQSIANPR